MNADTPSKTTTTKTVSKLAMSKTAKIILGVVVIGALATVAAVLIWYFVTRTKKSSGSGSGSHHSSSHASSSHASSSLPPEELLTLSELLEKSPFMNPAKNQIGKKTQFRAGKLGAKDFNSLIKKGGILPMGEDGEDFAKLH